MKIPFKNKFPLHYKVYQIEFQGIGRFSQESQKIKSKSFSD
jgi:hypothetical protein